MGLSGTPFGALDAIVFDFDGVILESVDIKTQAFLSLFADLPEHLPAIRRHHEQNVGLSRYYKFDWIYRELLDRDLSEEDSRDLGSRYSALVLEQILACPFVPGARELLEELRGRCPLFVASGTPEDELLMVVEKRGLAPYFDSVRGTPSLKPTIIGEILERLECPKDRALMIGDGASDWKAAREVGVHFVGRTLSDRSSPFEGSSLPVVEDLFGLSRLLGTGKDRSS